MRAQLADQSETAGEKSLTKDKAFEKWRTIIDQASGRESRAKR